MHEETVGQLEGLVERARSGERRALESLIQGIQDDVHNLALQMLWHPDDAADATQEILIRIVTRLDKFQGESSFRTWCYRVAANHLLSTRRRRRERAELSFEAFGEDLADGLGDSEVGAMYESEHAILVDEVKVGCSQGMLLCLSRSQRLAYVLGEILELPGPEAAAVLEISAATFRKRLQRARRRLEDFVRKHCGLVNPGATCRCGRRVERAIELGRVDPDNLLFAGTNARAGSPRGSEAMARAREALREVEELRSAAQLLRSNPTYEAPQDYASSLRRLLAPQRLPILNETRGVED